MNFLIAGLGNIGAEYENTRHNIGFKIADALALKHHVFFANDRLASVAQFRTRGKNVTLIKPATFMNASGRAVKYWLDKQKVPMENLLVMLDDIAIPFGSIRLRKSGSHGGHNGLRDIDEVFTHSNYARLRFGVGNNFPKGAQVHYVLGQWNAEEQKLLAEKIQLAVGCAEAFMFEGADRAMSTYNKT